MKKIFRPIKSYGEATEFETELFNMIGDDLHFLGMYKEIQEQAPRLASGDLDYREYKRMVGILPKRKPSDPILEEKENTNSENEKPLSQMLQEPVNLNRKDARL